MPYPQNRHWGPRPEPQGFVASWAQREAVAARLIALRQSRFARCFARVALGDRRRVGWAKGRGTGIRSRTSQRNVTEERTMNITRREMTTLTVSTCLATAFPIVSLADLAAPLGGALKVNPNDALYRKAALDKTKVHVNSKVRKEGPHNPTIALDRNWKEAKHNLPKGGATVIIDKEGNWSFSGLFDPYNPKLPPPRYFGSGSNLSPAQQASNLHAFNGSPVGRNAALVFALKSSLGYVMTFGYGGWGRKTGFFLEKEGDQPNVKNPLAGGGTG